MRPCDGNCANRVTPRAPSSRQLLFDVTCAWSGKHSGVTVRLHTWLLTLCEVVQKSKWLGYCIWSSDHGHHLLVFYVTPTHCNILSSFTSRQTSELQRVWMFFLFSDSKSFQISLIDKNKIKKRKFIIDYISISSFMYHGNKLCRFSFVHSLNKIFHSSESLSAACGRKFFFTVTLCESKVLKVIRRSRWLHFNLQPKNINLPWNH